MYRKKLELSKNTQTTTKSSQETNDQIKDDHFVSKEDEELAAYNLMQMCKVQSKGDTSKSSSVICKHRESILFCTSCGYFPRSTDTFLEFVNDTNDSGMSHSGQTIIKNNVNHEYIREFCDISYLKQESQRQVECETFDTNQRNYNLSDLYCANNREVIERSVESSNFQPTCDMDSDVEGNTIKSRIARKLRKSDVYQKNMKKPFGCTITGCEHKRYKNLNGLEYHLSHVHKFTSEKCTEFIKQYKKQKNFKKK